MIAWGRLVLVRLVLVRLVFIRLVLVRLVLVRLVLVRLVLVRWVLVRLINVSSSNLAYISPKQILFHWIKFRALAPVTHKRHGTDAPNQRSPKQKKTYLKKKTYITKKKKNHICGLKRDRYITKRFATI